MEKYTKTSENQVLNDFLPETLALINFRRRFPTTNNCLSFQKYTISKKVVV